MNGASDAILDRLVGMVAAAAQGGDRQGLDAGTTFSGLNLDSVSTLELLLALERSFGIELDAREMIDLGAFSSLGAMAGYIESRVAR
jgi:acyl carrier protein